MSLERALQAARDAARGVVGDGPLERAQSLLAAPHRVVVVGRTSSGKTTVVNRQLPPEDAHPVGLGGVTRAVRPRPSGDLLWLDCPGIDDPDAAVMELGPLLDEADAAVWVVDALQPMTASERAVLSQVLEPGTALWVVVGKLDLVEPEERDSVLERVRLLAAPYGAREVRGGDSRREPLLALTPAQIPPGPARKERIRAELVAQRQALSALPRVVHPDVLRERFRAGVKAAVEAIDAQIGRGGVTHETDALISLKQRAEALLREMAELTAGAGPRLPVPDAPAHTAMRQVVAGLAGGGGARRALKAGAARWLLEGELALEDWPSRRRWEAEAEARRKVEEALEGVEEALG
jgi:tRNA U34 5-carboxymethylaminomethyl modifying GTPase MnmE/TrmE